MSVPGPTIAASWSVPGVTLNADLVAAHNHLQSTVEHTRAYWREVINALRDQHCQQKQNGTLNLPLAKQEHAQLVYNYQMHMRSLYEEHQQRIERIYLFHAEMAQGGR